MGDSGVNVLNGSIKELTFVQVSTIDGRTLQNTEIGSMLNTAAPTPEPFGSMADDGFYSKLVSCSLTFFYCRRAILQLMTSECNFSQVMSIYCSVYWFREFSVNSKQYFLIDNSLKFSLPVHLAMHKIVWRFHLLISHVTEGFIHQTECFVLEPKFFFICFHIKITQFFTCFISVRELSSVEDQSISK